MIFKNGYWEISIEWHDHFAWFPVPINSDGDSAWFQRVQRRRPQGAATVTRRLEYRLPGSEVWGVTEPIWP